MLGPLRNRIGWALALLLIVSSAAQAKDHHVAARGTTAAGETWPDLASALASGQVQGGDRILLAPGFHGAVNIRDMDFDPAVTITGAGKGARVGLISLRHSSGLEFRDLQVWPDTLPKPRNRKGVTLVHTDEGSERIRFIGLDIRSAPEASEYLKWSAQEWTSRWRARGVRLSGPDMALINSTITAVSHGIIAEGARAQVIGNEVRGFSGDGMRGLSTGGLFRDNLVRDCVKVDGNHDDGFQAWVAEPGRWGPSALRNVVFERNRIFEWTGPEAHPLRCRLQGIAMFRGPFENWTIANNLVVVSAHHGLTIYGGRRCTVVNNTVIAANLQAGRSPWIRQRGLSSKVPRDPNFEITPGDRSQDNIFANNVATALKLGKTVRNPLAQNAVSKQPLRDFEDPANFDFRPSQNSRLLDAATPAHAPDEDLFGQPRPRGAGPDLGAVER